MPIRGKGNVLHHLFLRTKRTLLPYDTCITSKRGALFDDDQLSDNTPDFAFSEGANLLLNVLADGIVQCLVVGAHLVLCVMIG